MLPYIGAPSATCSIVTAGAVAASGADVVVRITADCPLLDPAVIAQTIRLRAMTGADYASNADPPTWPDGLDCEVVTAKALSAAAKEATRASDREHVTPFVRNNRARFTAETLVAPLPGLAAERWTLDTPDDLALLQAVAARLPSERRAILSRGASGARSRAAACANSTGGRLAMPALRLRPPTENSTSSANTIARSACSNAPNG